MSKHPTSDNRKYLPKFFVIIALSMLLGAVLGAGSAFLSRTALSEDALLSLRQALPTLLPIGIWGAALVLSLSMLVLYRQARALFTRWNGEDEAPMEQAGEKVSWVLLLSAVQLSLTLLLFGMATQLEAVALHVQLLMLGGLVAGLALCTLFQQKAVDLTRRMNPEKKGSVYDMKFHKKWLASCDENEQKQIGQAAYRAFRAVGNLCLALWALLVLLGNVYPVGLLPMILVMGIWGFSQVVFCLESIRLSRRK